MSKEEKERRIIDLYYNQGKTFREIAKELRVSFSYIAFVIKKYEAEQGKKNDADNSMNKNQQPSSSSSTEAYKLFSEGKTTIQVATMLNLPASKIIKLYREYWKLRGLDKLNTIYKDTNGKIWPLWKLYKELIKKRRMSIEQVANVVEIAIDKLPYMESLYEQVKEQVEKMQRTRQGLVNDMQALKYKISILDTTAFFCEQVRRRKHLEIRELTDKKDRIEKWIANIVNGEGYSKLKQIVKENGKAVLSENKKLISISFTALIQTIKADPQMIKLIQNMPSANDSEQYKDDNNNITKYLELNRDRILNFAEKNYENLVEALATNAIDAVGASSLSNPTLSLPQSSSPTFPYLSTQSYIFRIEESDTHHNSTGDITE